MHDFLLFMQFVRWYITSSLLSPNILNNLFSKPQSLYSSPQERDKFDL